MNPFSNAPISEASRRIGEEYSSEAAERPPIMDPATLRKLRDAGLILGAVLLLGVTLVCAGLAVTNLGPEEHFNFGYFYNALVYFTLAVILIAALRLLRSTDEPLD